MLKGQPSQLPIKVGAARAAAVEWVKQHASHEIGFRGAYFSGSTVEMSDDAELPAASDIDVVIVTDHAEPPLKLGKFVYKGALIEVTYLSWSQLADAEEVLASYHLAGSFRVNTIFSDPTGQLHQLYAQVSSRFADQMQVRRRCENVRQKIEKGLRTIDPSAPLHDLVTSWLFPTGITTHVLLVAALRNPTVRLRYLAAREVLAEYGHSSLYPELLELLGCTGLSPSRVEHHLNGLALTFDAAAAVAKTPFFFSSDITAAARPVAIDGSLKLIRNGNHLEAVFWMVATYARCHKIIAADAPPDLKHSLAPAFEEIIADLGVASTGDILRRAEDVIRFLPKLWETAENLLQTNPDITGR